MLEENPIQELPLEHDLESAVKSYRAEIDEITGHLLQNNYAVSLYTYRPHEVPNKFFFIREGSVYRYVESHRDHHNHIVDNSYSLARLDLAPEKDIVGLNFAELEKLNWDTAERVQASLYQGIERSSPLVPEVPTQNETSLLYHNPAAGILLSHSPLKSPDNYTDELIIDPKKTIININMFLNQIRTAFNIQKTIMATPQPKVA